MFFGLIKFGTSGLIGIDFGSSSIKAIALSKGQRTYHVDGIAEAPLMKGLIVDGRLEDVEKLTSVVKLLRKNFPSNYKNAAIAVTGADVITKVMKMSSSLGDLDLESRVEIEVENSIPFPLDEIFIDFEIIGTNEEDPLLNDLLVSAARKERVLTQAQCVDGSGLNTTIVDIASHASARAAGFVITPEFKSEGIAIVDIGASQMMLTILHQNNVIFTRAKNHGGAVCTQMISERYGVSIPEAERMKVENELPDGCDIDVITPFINTTINHLRVDLRMFTNSANKVDIKKVILTGGGSLMEPLVEKLKQDLEMDVEVDVAQPYLGFDFKNESDKNILKDLGPKYMMAIGLALRSFS